MTEQKFFQLWNACIENAIKSYVAKYNNFKVAYNIDEFRNLVWKNYNNFRPYFKDNYMKKYDKGKKEDGESEDGVIRIDRHKVAALIYLSLVSDNSNPILVLTPRRHSNKGEELVALHEIAYTASLNCIHSFIVAANNKNPESHKTKFLSNNGFQKCPNLICEKYQSYKESVIPRMVWAVEESARQFKGDTSLKLREMRVATNANMLANIFYFLELYSAS
ncbi:hypothetical protein AGMMS49938_18720 [Fibrobacterales bacterium]|nr:hypothetical protein AGMMS49938_18720 [Fibrobacterales bacterium]